MGHALRAVRQMHSDASRLLQDCDGAVGGGRKPVYETATCDLTWKVAAAQWMAEGVYRYYDVDAPGDGVVEGVMIAFIDKQTPEKVPEPLLIAGRIKYRLDGKVSAKGTCKEWDLWHPYFDWPGGGVTGSVLTIPTKEPDRIEWVKLIAVPLYSVSSMAVLQGLMESLRTSVTPAAPR